MARDLWQPVKILGKGPWSLLPSQTWSMLTDFFIFAAGLSLFYGVVVLARSWFGPFNPQVEISRDPRMLAGLRRVLADAHWHCLFSLAGIHVDLRLRRRLQRAGRAHHDSAARHPAIHPGAQLSAGSDAGHGRLVSASSARRRAGSHPAHLHRTGLEHGVQLLLVAEEHSARDARGRQDLPL